MRKTLQKILRFIPAAMAVTVLLLSGPAAYAQRNTVNGVVTDNTGMPLAGVSVIVKGTNVGVTTRSLGEYTINASPDATLVFQFLGMADKEEPVNNRSVINVTLEEQRNIMEDVIVVGYGTQKRRDVVGAIEQISGDVFEMRSNPSITRSLQGEISGVNIVMTSGRPSANPAIKIRSDVTSIGSGGDAIVMIDGIEGDISTVNPDDIESVSVLKDASSTAVYGARGTFGVVLITTKKPSKDRVTVNYKGTYSLLNRTIKPEVVTNGLEYATSFREAWVNYKGQEPSNFNNVFLSKAEGGFAAWYAELQRRDADPSLEKWRINSNGYYEYYGNTDWHDVVFRDYTWGTDHNISISGAGEKTSYYVSGRYFEQGGIYNAGDEKFNQFNVRANGSIKIKPWLKLENTTDFIRRYQKEPLVMYSNNGNDMNEIFPIQRQMEHQAFPMAMPTNPDGTWTHTAVYIGWAGFNEDTSWRKSSKFDMRNTTALTADIIKDQLVARADFSYYHNYTERNQTGGKYTGYEGPTHTVERQSYSYYEERSYYRENISASATLTWTPKFQNVNHNLSVMGGWNLEDRKYKTNKLFRRDLLIADKPNLSLLDGEIYSMVDNGSWSQGLSGAFFRASYNFKGKYLIETSGRYDGSTKFPTGSKWGFFPSASAGYRISEENFIKDNLHWVDNIKIRVSAGSSGNALISNPYLYYPLSSVGKSGAITGDGNQLTYVGAPSIMPESLTWETATTYNLGLDIDLFKGRLNFVGDVYRKITSDMFTQGPEIPAVAGYDAPKGNYADMRTDGYELSLAWRDTFKVAGKDFTYRIKASFWDSVSKITRYTTQTKLLPTVYTNPNGTGSRYYEGMTIGEIWGYRFDRFFTSAEDALNHGQGLIKNHESGSVWEAGDIKFKDLDKDGKITTGDYTLENHGDLEKIGNTMPRYRYSLNLSANWNGIGISMMWQGVGKRDWYPSKETSYFWGQYGRPYGFALPWHNAENQAGIDAAGNLVNGDAYWPRRRAYISEVSAGTLANPIDRYLQDASYLRLKNLTVDYTFPNKLSSKLGMSVLKVFVSGDNLLTFTPLKKWAKNFDPEVITAGDPDYWNTAGTAGDGYSYPMMRTFTIGLNITF